MTCKVSYHPAYIIPPHDNTCLMKAVVPIPWQSFHFASLITPTLHHVCDCDGQTKGQHLVTVMEAMLIINTSLKPSNHIWHNHQSMLYLCSPVMEDH